MNQQSPLIINPDNKTDGLVVPERPVIDLAIRHFDHKVRMFRIIGTWLKQGSREPCMVIIPRYQKISEITPCIIPLSSAWKWTEEVGDHIWSAHTAVSFAMVLPINPFSEPDVNLLLDVIRGRLSDLLSMPPAPDLGKDIAGDITMTDRNTGKVIQKDLMDDV